MARRTAAPVAASRSKSSFEGKKRKRKQQREESGKYAAIESDKKKLRGENSENHQGSAFTDSLRKDVTFPHRYILAPMVGASELAFRLLCRRYGTQLAYTPMMSAQKFASSQTYREDEFHTCPQDRPLVCHFAANNPEDFAQAARLVESSCDAIDLNLGCPQRTAYIGHFGSYLLDYKDRDLVCSIIRAGAQAVKIPIFCKIRLLDKTQETIRLCQELHNAGASLIAIHARYRASWERKGPGARDGPALLDQVAEIKKVVRGIPIIANGNTITYSDVEDNLKLTGADGLMSAEGILDNPALFLPRFGENERAEGGLEVDIDSAKEHNKLDKKIRKIVRIEKKLSKASPATMADVESKRRIEKRLRLEKAIMQLKTEGKNKSAEQQKTVLGWLYNRSHDKLVLAEEYLQLATAYPVKMRSVIFHTRRMLKQLLDQYQLMEECLSCNSMDNIRAIIKGLSNTKRTLNCLCLIRRKRRMRRKHWNANDKKKENGKHTKLEC